MSFSRWKYRKTAKYEVEEYKTFAGKHAIARVADIYDGDTITVATKLPGDRREFLYKFRLHGLDTPEKARVSKDDPDRLLHMEAGIKVGQKLEKKIPIGSVVILEGTSEDKYGRLLGTIYIPKWNWTKLRWIRGENVNKWLVHEGLALRYDGGKKPLSGKASSLALWTGAEA